MTVWIFGCEEGPKEHCDRQPGQSSSTATHTPTSFTEPELHLHIRGTPIVEAAVQAAHGLIGGKLECHVRHILQQVGQVPGEEAAHPGCVCDGPCRMEHVGVYASLLIDETRSKHACGETCRCNTAHTLHR